MNRLIQKMTMSLFVVVSIFQAANVIADELQTLKNLERQRTNLIEVLLDMQLSAEERNKKIQAKTRRLVDLERMVLRDSRLEGNTDVLVRRAFNKYDMTFLAHASVESGQYISAHWYDQIGLSNNSILNAKKGVR